MTGIKSLSAAKGFEELQQQLATLNSTQINESNSDEVSDYEDEDVYGVDDPITSEDMRRRMERMNRVSALLGQRMLSGWTLTGVNCAEEECACPLVRSRDGKLECVSCNKQYSQTDDGELREVPKPATSNNSQQPVVTESVKPSAAKFLDGSIKSDMPAKVVGSTKKNVPNVSSILGEKMLAGYTLLAQSCPNETCTCPLIRYRNGPMQCVQCGATVLTETEAKEAELKMAETEENEKKVETSEASIETQAQPKFNDSRLTNQEPLTSAVYDPITSKTDTSVPSNNFQTAANRTRSVLIDKLEKCSSILDSQEIGVERITAIAIAIEHISLAMKALNTV